MNDLSNKQKTGQVLGTFLFLFGFVFGLLVNIRVSWSFVEGMSFWGYPEEIYFDPSLTSEGKITQFKCPILITPNESKEVRIQVNNPMEYAIKPVVEFLESNPDPQENVARVTQTLFIEPGQKAIATFPLSIHNDKSFHIRYLRAFLHQESFYPAALTKHCGIVVFQLGGLSSSAIIILGIAIYAILMLSGFLLFKLTSKNSLSSPNRIKSGMLVLGSFMIGITLANLIVLSFVAMILIVLAVLAFFSILQHIF